MKTDKEDMLKTYNEFKALCFEKGYEFYFDGIQYFTNGKYAVLTYWPKGNKKEEVQLTSLEEGDVLTTTKELYKKGIDNLIKYG